MSYIAYRRWGHCEKNPPVETMREILSELDADEDEHVQVSLTHESGWGLSMFSSGLLVWENVELNDQPQHQPAVSRDYALGLWQKLSKGETESISAEPWHAGYGD